MKSVRIIIITFLTLATSSTIKADTFECGGICFLVLSLQDKTVGVIKCEDDVACASESVIIPQEVSFNNNVYRVISIEENAFRGCSCLKDVEIPISIKTIKKGAFSNCSGLIEIFLPASVESVEYGAFVSCSSLKAITVSRQNAKYSSKKGVLYSKDMTELITCPEGIAEIEIPASVRKIGNYTLFSNSKKIKLYRRF